MKRFWCVGFGIAILFCSVMGYAGSGYVTESARTIPVAYEADIAVIGGSSYGIAAAAAAAKEGANVFLAAPRPYLGEDLCAPYKLWIPDGFEMSHPLAQRLFKALQPVDLTSYPFQYKPSVVASPKHPDTKALTRLTDGQWRDAPSQSVQYDENVTITADLGKTAFVESVHVMAYQRPADFVVETVAVWISPDGMDWTPQPSISNPTKGQGTIENGCVDFALKINAETRYVKFQINKTENSSRILLGEVLLSPKADEKEQSPYANPTTPFQVKYELDQVLIEAGVKFLYSCMVTDALIDDVGQVCGFIMANRSGRQAVLAKTVIDTTIRGDFARMAGVPFKAYPAGEQIFKRIVVGGEPQAQSAAFAKPISASVVAEANRAKSQYNTYDAYEYTLSIPMKDASFASFAAAEQRARDLTWQDGQVDASEVLFQIPPDRCVEDTDPTSSRLSGILSTPVKNLYLLAGWHYENESPLSLIPLGEGLGQELAFLSRSIPAPKAPRVKSTLQRPVAQGEVRELLDGIRNLDTGKTIASPERSLPVIGEYDVVVIGGGTGGAPAGIGAARQGAKTLVVEYLNGLGGVGTLGYIGSYYIGYKKGFTTEIDEGVAQMKDNRENRRGWNVDNKMEWYRRELREAGADIWFGCMGSGAFVENGKVKGAVVITPQGRGVVLAKVVIDSTGNADVAAAAGAETVFLGPDNDALQGTGLPPRILGENYTNTDYTFIHDDDMLDLMMAFVVAKEKFQGMYDMGQIIDSRERRRIVGDYTISPLDIINEKRFEDTISLGYSNFDSHGYTTHEYFALRFPDKVNKTADTPYRALLPKGLDGIIVTGLGISAHRDAIPILRMQACIQNQGYAMGTAASMAVENGGHTRQIDVRQLQKHLVEKGSLPDRVLTDQDTPPYQREDLVQAVQTVIEDFEGLGVILAQPQDALPLLQEAYAVVAKKELANSVGEKNDFSFDGLESADVEKAKVLYAHILGMMGDPSGSETLTEYVAANGWDSGWSFTGMGQFGGSLSPLDSHILSLGKTRDTRALPVIHEKLKTLDAQSEFSHHRAVALALETMRNPSSAKPLAELLQKPGMSGHAWSSLDQAVDKTPKGFGDDTTVRDYTLRELLLARALYRCGDYQGVGEKILNAYANDLRAHYSQHAKAVLGEGK